MTQKPLPRLDKHPELREILIPYCRLDYGDVWEDAQGRHRVGCLDATNREDVLMLMNGRRAALAIEDPPYNLVAFEERTVSEYIAWCRKWVDTTLRSMEENSALYVWLGADQNHHFQPLPEFMLMMREFPITSRSFITLRNQRGYGTSNNWMAVRQELLYYTKGHPVFTVQYTDIPKILRGYYKAVGGVVQENLERSRSDTIRPGNVWVDIQQVFYRMEENVSGCYVQKPLKAVERIIEASSAPGNLVIDFFSHSGTTLLAAEIHRRPCYTMDIDPVFCEITIRRLERFRRCGKRGWQHSNPFESEIDIEALEAMLNHSRVPTTPEEAQLELFD
ncbi:site-specific DNA-methyltransferase [Candidatus Poribacteria bacterium]|nr:site-specific DNA-methyltransferase [Candidatus Poribacteria bacterium]